MGFLFMTRQDYENKSFEELMCDLEYNMNDIHSRESIIAMVKHEIDEDNLFVARHILDGIDNEYAEWYQYDRCMGTLQSITALKDKEDVEHLIEE